MRNIADDINYIDIGQRIRQKRDVMKLTQEKLATLAELETPTISNIENGKSKISLPSLIKIANALEMPADEILCGSLEISQYVYTGKIMEQLKDCSIEELQIIEKMTECLLGQLRGSNRKK